MIKLNVITTKETDSVELPQSWSETSTQIFQRIANEWNCKDLVQIFSICSGIDYNTIRESKDGVLERKLFAATKYIFDTKPNFDKLPLPKSITWRGREIKIPRDIGRLSIGQSIAVKQKMFEHAEFIKDKLQVPMFSKDFLFDGIISYAVAVYLQPIIDGVAFDYELAEDIEREILKRPITETYPLGFFLLMNVSGLGATLKKDWWPLRTLTQIGTTRIFSKMIQKWIKMRRRLLRERGSKSIPS